MNDQRSRSIDRIDGLLLRENLSCDTVQNALTDVLPPGAVHAVLYLACGAVDTDPEDTDSELYRAVLALARLFLQDATGSGLVFFTDGSIRPRFRS